MKKSEKNAASPRGVKETVGKVVGVVSKLPAWVVRIHSELKQLIDRLSKLDAAIDRLESLVGARQATKNQKETLKLMKRQRRAMASYRAVLEARAEQAARNPDEKL